MGREQEDKKIINFVPIDPETHTQLVELANQQGIKLNDFLGLLADEWAFTWKPPEDKRRERALFWNWVELTRRKRMQDMVYSMVSIYQQLGESEEMADIIEEQCKVAGISPSDLQMIHAEVSSDPLSSIIAQSRGGTKFSQCLAWLSSIFRQVGPEIAVRDLRQLAKAEGFAWAMVNKAKGQIRDDPETQVDLVSEKRGHYWVWIMLDRESQKPIERGQDAHGERVQNSTQGNDKQHSESG